MHFIIHTSDSATVAHLCAASDKKDVIHSEGTHGLTGESSSKQWDGQAIMANTMNGSVSELVPRVSHCRECFIPRAPQRDGDVFGGDSINILKQFTTTW